MLQYISYRYSRSSISQTVSVDPLLMSVAAEAVACLAEKKVTELRAALLLNQKHIRNCQQQSRREAASLLKGGLSCHSERKVLAVYALSNWDLSLALRAAQRLSRLPQCSAAFPTSDSVRALFRNHNWEDFLMLHDEPLGTCPKVCTAVPPGTRCLVLGEASKSFSRRGTISGRCVSLL